MTTEAQATAAPSTVKLCGKEYRVRPNIERDQGEFVLWCQDQKMALAYRSAKAMDDGNGMAQKLIEHAYNDASRLTTTHPEVLAMMIDIRGIVQLCWYALRDFYPDLSYTPPTVDGEQSETEYGAKAVALMLMDPITLEEWSKKYEQLNIGSRDTTVNPRKSRRRVRKRERISRRQ